MGRYMRRCERAEKNAVVGVGERGGGVMTTARAPATAASEAEGLRSTAAKRTRKEWEGELKLASTYVELRRRCRAVIAPDNSISPAVSESCADETNCCSGNSVQMPAACCSSDDSSELVKDPLGSIDPDEEITELETSMHSDCRERRETTRSREFRAEESDDQESMAKSAEANYRHRPTVQKIPSEFEIEEFFAAAEKDIQKSFIEKYNFDLVRDIPLKGRYEWIPVKP
ncbi:hypothetical protein Nepgr_026444 [Nepenthes gracilis]|uniref:Cyclin-dependent kinase inhibitor domain-containing protein n=1 Tax=Nepenthes gracilis TaxID=150966 RepID=A0AAD3Y2H2_NEPGR|nr:hypothetical protein Nepgr_026444 [Nepenthes gracilis]